MEGRLVCHDQALPISQSHWPENKRCRLDSHFWSVGKALMMLLSTVWPGLLATEARGNFAMIFVMQPALFQSLSEMPRCLKVICGDPLVKIEAEQLKPK